MKLHLTPERLAEIKERCAKTTPGPWAHVSDMPSYAVWSQTAERDVVHSQRRLGVGKNRGIDGTEERDAVFIAAARQDVPDAIADIETLQLRVRELEKVLEWYAGPAFAQFFSWAGMRQPYPILDDQGQKAREVLNKK